MKLLHVDASILGTGSVSRELSAMIVERLVAGRSDVEVTRRDLADVDPPHMTLASLPGAHPAAMADADLDGPARTVRADSDRMLAEFLDADTVVIGAPMYNFTVPTQLKAWIDRLVVPGRTFRMGADGPQGLAGASGWSSRSPAAASTAQTRRRPRPSTRRGPAADRLRLHGDRGSRVRPRGGAEGGRARQGGRAGLRPRGRGTPGGMRARRLGGAPRMARPVLRTAGERRS